MEHRHRPVKKLKSKLNEKLGKRERERMREREREREREIEIEGERKRERKREKEREREREINNIYYRSSIKWSRSKIIVSTKWNVRFMISDPIGKRNWN